MRYSERRCKAPARGTMNVRTRTKGSVEGRATSRTDSSRPSRLDLNPKCHATRQDHSRLRRVQESELLHHEEQAPPSRARRVEEVLPAVQQASGPQGNQVMADAVARPESPGI